MKSLILGRGEIGKAVGEVIQRTDVVRTYDIKEGQPPEVKGIDILHICFPYADEASFIEAVNFYVQKYKPEHVIIWSTVAIGTTKKIRGAVHSPVEGRHPNLALSIRSMPRWIGANDESEVEFFEDYFGHLLLKTKTLESSDFTEFLKLRSTAKYGINLLWTDYEASVARALNMDFDVVQEFDKDYNKLYHNLGMDWAQRYILDPPNGKIGGHCVVPNAEMLDDQYPYELLKMIKGMK